MALDIPNYIVHYCRGKPFQSITSVSENLRSNIIEALHEGNAWGLSRFKNEEYLKSRVLVEKQMHDSFMIKGGTPDIEFPFYFFLGRSSKFEEHSKNIGYKIDLAAIEVNKVSFTYGDSMLGFDESNRKLSGLKYQNDLCQKIFTLDELPRLYSEVANLGHESLHIEAQLWCVPNTQTVSLVGQ